MDIVERDLVSGGLQETLDGLDKDGILDLRFR